MINQKLSFWITRSQQNEYTQITNKVEAIKKMPYPSDVKGLQRFLGMVNYLAKFIPNSSSHTVHFRRLLEKGSAWSFDNIHR